MARRSRKNEEPFVAEPKYHVLKDGSVVAMTSTREAAVDLIKEYMKAETHYLLRSTYSIIYGAEEFISYD